MQGLDIERFRHVLKLFDDAQSRPDSPDSLYYYYYHVEGALDEYTKVNNQAVFRVKAFDFWASRKLTNLNTPGVILGVSQFDGKTPQMLPYANRLILIPWNLVFGNPRDPLKGLFLVEESFAKRERRSPIIHVTLLWGDRATISQHQDFASLKEINLEDNPYLCLRERDGQFIMNCPKNDVGVYPRYLKTWVHLCCLEDLTIPLNHIVPITIEDMIKEKNLPPVMQLSEIRALVEQHAPNNNQPPNDEDESDQDSDSQSRESMQVEENGENQPPEVEEEIVDQVADPRPDIDIEEERKEGEVDGHNLSISNIEISQLNLQENGQPKDFKATQSSGLLGSTQAHTLTRGSQVEEEFE